MAVALLIFPSVVNARENEESPSVIPVVLHVVADKVDCPSSTELTSRIGELFYNAPTLESVLELRVTFRTQHEGWMARIEAGHDDTSTIREITTVHLDCRALLESVAFSIAMMVDSHALAHSAVARKENVPEPGKKKCTSTTTSIASGAVTDRHVPQRSWVLRASSGPEAAFGFLPNTALALRSSIGVRFRAPFLVDIAYSWWPRQSQRDESGKTSVSAHELQLTGCPVLELRPFELAACGGVRIALLDGYAVLTRMGTMPVLFTGSAHQWLASIHAELRVGIILPAHMRSEITAGFFVPISERHVEFRESMREYAVASVVGHLRFAVGIELP